MSVNELVCVTVLARPILFIDIVFSMVSVLASYLSWILRSFLNGLSHLLKRSEGIYLMCVAVFVVRHYGGRSVH